MTTEKTLRQQITTSLVLFFIVAIIPTLVSASQSVAGHRGERKIILIGGYDACNNTFIAFCPGEPAPDPAKGHDRSTEHPLWTPIIDFLTEDDPGGSEENFLVRRIDLKDDDFFILSYSSIRSRYEKTDTNQFDFSSPKYIAQDTCLSMTKERRFDLYCMVEKSEIERAVQNISEIINDSRYSKTEFDIVSFSEGGVVATYWAGSLDQDDPLLKRVNSIITIDSPVKGGVINLPFTQRSVEFVSEDVRKIMAKAPSRIPIYTIRNRSDRVVPWDQATMDGVWTDKIIIDLVHNPLLFHDVRPNGSVQKRVAAALLSGKINKPNTPNPQIVSRWPILGPRSFKVNVFKPTFVQQDSSSTNSMSALGLKKDDFDVKIGGQPAQVKRVGGLLSFPGSEYLLELKISPPDLPDGFYDIYVDPKNTHLDIPGQQDIADTEARSVVYGPIPNVDVILAIDRSGSMSGDKIAAAKEAASAFVEFMTEGDKIGIVSFSDTINVDFPLTTLTSTTREGAKATIDTLIAGGTTSIGGGLQSGLDELSSRGDPLHPHAIVLLSNGLQNTAPFVEDVLPDVKRAGVIVYTVGLGADTAKELLQRIARETRGKFRFAPSPKELLEIYNDLLAAITGKQRLFVKTGTIGPGDSKTILALVTARTFQATFLVNWENPGANIHVELITPNGTVIDPSATDPDIRFGSGRTFQFFRVRNLQRFSGLLGGLWTMRITRAASASSRMLQQGVEPFTVSASAESELQMEVGTDESSYFTFEPIQIAASLNDPEPISGANVTTTVQTPSGVSQLILFDDGVHEDGAADDGIYANTFEDTSVEGVYELDVQATGTLSTGESFTRFAKLSILVETHPAPPADLFVRKSGPAQIIAGSDLIYTITYGNNGPATARDVMLSDFIPEGMTIVGDTLGGGTEIPGLGTAWQVGDLTPGFERAFELTVSVPPTVTGRITNTVGINSMPSDPTILASTDPDFTNNAAEVATQVLARTCSITGKVSLQGRSNHSGATIRIDGTSFATTDSDGQFTVEDLDTGAHIVTASHLGYLSSKDNSVPCPAGQATQMLETTLLGGDTNNDKDINLFDLAKVGAAYGSCTGDGWFRPEADINETGCVDIFDLVLVSTNYGRTGPTGWPTQLTNASAPPAFTGEPNYQPDLERPFMRKLADVEWWDIQINDVSNLYGIDVTIAFDPTLVKVVDADPDRAGVQILPGPLFAERKFFIAKNLVTVDEKTGIGTVRFAATLLNPSEPIDADGIVATIPVRLIGKPALTTPANFSIRDALLADKDGHPLLIKREGSTIRHPSSRRPRLSVVAQ